MKNMKSNCGLAASFLKGLASPNRLLILCELASGEKSVSELIAATDIAQSSMSQHLNKLKDEGIIGFRREHRTLYYQIENEATLKIMAVLYNEFCQEKTSDDTDN